MATSRYRPRLPKKRRARSTKKSIDMTDHVDALRSPGPVAAAPSITISKVRGRRRIFVDRLASRLVTLGGVIIIASILAILLVIVAEVYHLFKKPTATAERTITAALDSAPMALGV